MGGGVAIWLATISLPLLGAVWLRVAAASLPEPLARHVSGAWSRSGELGAILAAWR